jgi:hypothetical protein
MHGAAHLLEEGPALFHHLLCLGIHFLMQMQASSTKECGTEAVQSSIFWE